MLACFVIQPLDPGSFDARYEDLFEPAIRAADLEPCRVERRRGAPAIPVAEIEAGIRNSALCLADATAESATVWFALGYAMACGREVVLLCDRSRRQFPLDLRQFHVIFCQPGAAGDSEALREQITKRLAAAVAKQARISAAAKLAAAGGPLNGLASHELVALTVVGQNVESPGDPVSFYAIRRDMERAGFTRIAMMLGLASLLGKGLVSVREEYDDWFGELQKTYSLTEAGMIWLLNNLDKLVLAQPRGEGLSS